MNIVIKESFRISHTSEEIVIKKASLLPGKFIIIEGIKFTTEELVGVNAKHNRIRCNTCGDTLESYYYYHSIICSCGKCKIDGGSRELIRECTGPFTELSNYYSNEKT